MTSSPFVMITGAPGADGNDGAKARAGPTMKKVANAHNANPQTGRRFLARASVSIPAQP